MTDWLVHDSLAPNVDGGLAPLFEGAARGELVLPFCGSCDVTWELEQLRCDACGASSVCWRAVDLHGIVHSTTMVHRREPGLIVHDAPYPVIDVELTSGHRLLMTTSTPAARPVRLGDEVRVVFRDVGGVAVPAVAVAPVVSPAVAVAPVAASPEVPR